MTTAATTTTSNLLILPILYHHNPAPPIFTHTTQCWVGRGREGGGEGWTTAPVERALFCPSFYGVWGGCSPLIIDVGSRWDCAETPPPPKDPWKSGQLAEGWWSFDRRIGWGDLPLPNSVLHFLLFLPSTVK